MSLIEEALRKQREETERTQPAAAAAPVPQPPAAPAAPPPPLPPPALPEPAIAGGDQPEKSRRTWRLLVGVGAVLLLVILFILWMFVYGLSLFHRGHETLPGADTIATVKHPAPVAATQAVGTVPAATVTSAVVSVVEPVAPTGRPPTTSTGTVAIVVPPPATTTVAPVVVAAVPRVNPPPAVAPTATVEAVKLPVIWPRLTVSGFMGGNSVRSTVIINGQMLTQGEVVEGAKIIAIDKKRGVTLNFSGETRTLAVGTSTE